jgi:hypothetical protein
MPFCQGSKLIVKIKGNVPSLEPVGILPLLSVLIAVLAFMIIRVLEPGLSCLRSAFYFRGSSDRRHRSPLNPRSQNSDSLMVWDVAGALMMGCAAAIFSEPDQAAQFFEQPVEQHPGYAAIGDSHQAGPLWQPAGCDVGLESSWSGPF